MLGMGDWVCGMVRSRGCFRQSRRWEQEGVVLMGQARRWCCVSLYADSGCRGGCRGCDVVVVLSWSGDALGPDLSEVVCGN